MRILHHIATLLLLLVLAVALPLSGVIAYLIYSEGLRSEADAIEQVRAMAREIAYDSKAFLERGREQLSYLAARPAVRALDPARCDPMITELQRMNTIYSVITLTDALGQTLCLSLAQANALPSYADREWFQSAIRSTGFRAGTPVVGRLTGTPVAPLTMPVLNAEGKPAGVLMFPASLREITRLVEKSAHLPPGSLITVVGGEGTIIAHSPDPDKLLGKDGRQILALADQIEQREGAASFRGVDGVIRLTAFTTLPGVEWLVSVGVPVEAVAARYRERLQQSVTIVIAVLACVLLLALYSGQHIRKPVHSLAQAARRAAQGELSVRAAEAGPVEIADVAREFNRMLAIRAEAEDSLRQHNAQLSAVNKELDAFAYSASHDLRSPLQTIDGFSRALLEDYSDKLDATAKDYLQRLRAASQRLAQLVDDLLKLSRLTRADMALAPVDLGELAHSVADELRARDPGREVAFDIAADATAQGDRRLLAALMKNLLGNAWKFTSRHPRARIEFGVAEREGERVYYVRDDGAGFDMVHAEKLFVPFQRLHTVSEFPGNGIGLALVRRIVLRHGGRIWAESAPEKGTTFYFTIPGAPAGAPDSA